MEWIHVSEKLPANSVGVLVLHTGSESHYSAPGKIWIAWHVSNEPLKEIPEAWVKKFGTEEGEKQWREAEKRSPYYKIPLWRTAWDIEIGIVTHWMPLPEAPCP